MIQVCSTFHKARVSITNTLPDEIGVGQGGLLSRERARREEQLFLVAGILLSGFGLLGC